MIERLMNLRFTTLSQEQTSFWRSMQSNLYEILMKNTDEYNSDLR